MLGSKVFLIEQKQVLQAFEKTISHISVQGRNHQVGRLWRVYKVRFRCFLFEIFFI